MSGGRRLRWLRWLREALPPAPEPGRGGDAGLYGPGSAAWRIARERLVVAGGPTALLLQVAHPLVAAGVADHSDFVVDPLRRLRGTLDAVLRVTFGDSEQVREAVTRVARRHENVRGQLGAGVGSFGSGTPYRADDPELDLWVFATLVWTAIRVLDVFGRGVPAAERDAYYADMAEFGRLFGADPAAMPVDYAALAAYVDYQIREVLVVDEVAALLARQILDPQPPLLPAGWRGLPALLAAGLLPEPLRKAYGLSWRRRERLAFAALARLTRLTLPVWPGVVRYWPHYRTARRRMADRAGLAGAARPAR